MGNCAPVSKRFGLEVTLILLLTFYWISYCHTKRQAGIEKCNPSLGLEERTYGNSVHSVNFYHIANHPPPPATLDIVTILVLQ